MAKQAVRCPADDGHGPCVPVRLSTFGAEPTNALMMVTKLPPRSRIRRGAIGLAACWSAAVLALFVPFLWRMLVPALLVDGIMMAMVCGWAVASSAGPRNVSAMLDQPAVRGDRRGSAQPDHVLSPLSYDRDRRRRRKLDKERASGHLRLAWACCSAGPLIRGQYRRQPLEDATVRPERDDRNNRSRRHGREHPQQGSVFAEGRHDAGAGDHRQCHEPVREARKQNPGFDDIEALDSALDAQHDPERRPSERQQ